MKETDLIDEPPPVRPLLVIEMPLAISDEAALQISDLMHRFTTGFDELYGHQIQRAQKARQNAIKNFLREQATLRREQRFRAAQLDLAFNAAGGVDELDAVDDEPSF